MFSPGFPTHTINVSFDKPKGGRFHLINLQVCSSMLEYKSKVLYFYYISIYLYFTHMLVYIKSMLYIVL